MSKAFSLEFLAWLKQVKKLVPDSARTYSSCVDRLAGWTFAATNGTMAQLCNQADGQAFVRDFDAAAAGLAKGKARKYGSAFRYFVEFVGASAE